MDAYRAGEYRQVSAYLTEAATFLYLLPYNVLMLARYQRLHWLFLCCVMGTVFTSLAHGQPSESVFAAQSANPKKNPAPADVVKIALYADWFQPQEGSRFELLLQFDIAPGWHIYAPVSGDESATPTVVKLTLPPGLTAEKPLWPPPTKVTFGNLTLHEYKGQFGVLVPIQVGKGYQESVYASSSFQPDLFAEITFGACSEDTCLPPHTTRIGIVLKSNQNITLPTEKLFAAARKQISASPASDSQPATASQPASSLILHPSSFSTTDLLLQLSLAFLAGLILNLMPCVLPVISLKVLSFVQQAQEDRGRILALTGAFVAGMMAVFVGFGVAVVVGRESFGVSVGQSSLFAVPTFLIAMSIVIFTMGLSLLGVFELSVPGLVSKAAGGEEREGLLGAFSKGILATLLGIPCVGPFMGGAVTFALAQSAPVAIGIWTAMGLGMSLPYILLGIHPAWVRLIPKPGMWMVYFKQAMGFLLMGTVVWLLWSLNLPRLYAGLLAGLLTIAIAAWMHGQLAPPHVSARRKTWVNSLAVVVLAIGGGYGWWLSTPESAEWIEWSPQAMQQYQSRIRLVDFTARWCLICQQNKLVLDTQAVRDKLREVGGVKLIADWTNHPPEITKEMERIAKKGANVPLLAIYPADAGPEAQPIVLESLVTSEQVQSALTTAGESHK